MILCYHNGALGHTTLALIECCTQEGGINFPLFEKNQNLHHYKCSTNLVRVMHPECDVIQEQQSGNYVVSSTSKSIRGRLLILLMGLNKWNKHIPDINSPSVFKQHGNTYGEQIEILAQTLADKLQNNNEWFLNTNCILDILNYWENHNAVNNFLIECKLTPNKKLVENFCILVAESNNTYYNTMQHCVKVAEAILSDKEENINLTFFETALIYALLLINFKTDVSKLRLLKQPPTNTLDIIKIFKE